MREQEIKFCVNVDHIQWKQNKPYIENGSLAQRGGWNEPHEVAGAIRTLYIYGIPYNV